MRKTHIFADATATVESLSSRGNPVFWKGVVVLHGDTLHINKMLIAIAGARPHTSWNPENIPNVDKALSLAHSHFRDYSRGKWMPAEETSPAKSVQVLVYSPEWVDEDFCPTGVREGFLSDDEGWVVSCWDPQQDTWYAASYCEPTAWRKMPGEPK